MTARLAAFISVVTVAGCIGATPYQRRGSNGGFEDFPKDAVTYVVTFEGNSETSGELVQMYLHYRCAELTVETGHDFFVVLEEENRDRTGQWQTPGYATTTGSVSGVGRTAYVEHQTTYVPGQTGTYVEPGRSAKIRLSSGTKPEGAFDAREVMRLLGPRIGVASPAPGPR